MIYKRIKDIKSNFIFLSSKDFIVYEELFHLIFKLSFDYKNINKLDINKDIINEEIITLCPETYHLYKSKYKISLFIFSVDEHFSHFYNLAKYIKANKIKNKEDLKFNNRFFNNFLWTFFPDKSKKNFFVKMVNKLNLNFFKFYITNKIWFPFIRHDENIFKGIKVGYSTNNCYMNFNKLLKKDFEFILSKIDDEESKKIFEITMFGRPREVKEQYYNLFFDYDQYMHHLNFDKSTIINLGVASGFEIPFFLTQNIKQLINVDPTGDKLLSEYVRKFTNLYKNKIIFNEQFLYSDKNTWIKNKLESTNLNEIIKKYNLNSNIIIKSDIEGLEMTMLDELDLIIKELRPQLAISIYHTSNEMFPIHSQLTHIPKRIIQSSHNYKFFIKHYTYNRRETIFYAVPIEKIN